MALVLAACHRAPPPPSNVTPQKALATSLRLTAEGDLDGLMRNRLPPADYSAWRAQWAKQHAHPIPASIAHQKQFAQIMRLLTAPDAEAALRKRLAPQLAQLRSGKDATIPIFASILEATGKDLVTNSPQLGTAQKQLATAALGAVVTWAQKADLGNAKKADKAIAIATATARQLHVATLAQWRALDYAQTMHAYGVIWRGLENILDIYGLHLADALTSADVSVPLNNVTHVIVKLDLTIAGKHLSGQWPMVEQAGHWYDAALLTAWEKAHPASASSGAQPAAAGSTAPASAASTGAAPGPAAAASTSTAPASAAQRRS
ncbi:MAG TPA: hypothetical protein VF292_15100 [Rhodanobacteraceae bacterium]